MLTEGIEKVEQVLSEYGQEDQKLILQNVNARQAKKLQQAYVEEAAGNAMSKIPGVGAGLNMLKRFGKSDKPLGE